MAREVLEHSIWRETYQQYTAFGEGDLAEEILGQGKPPLVFEDEGRMMKAEQQAEEQERTETQGKEQLRVITTTRDWEYRPAINPKQGARPKQAYKCLTAYIKINGTKALALFDSGSSINAISNEFARVAKTKLFELEKPTPLQLGTIGSRSVINFGTRTLLAIGGIKQEIYLDIVNLDHYDAVVGVPLMTTLGICLDFDKKEIRIRDGPSIPSLKAGEEVAAAKPRKKEVERPSNQKEKCKD